MELSTIIGNWSDFDKIKITVLKITEVAKAFYSGNPELRSTNVFVGKLLGQIFAQI